MRKFIGWLKKFIIEYWREGILLAALSGFVTIAYYFTFERPENTFEQAFMILGMAAFAAVAVVMIRQLWRKKWKDAVTERVQKVFGRLQRLLESFSQKLGITKRTKKSVLSGKTKVIFDKKSDWEKYRGPVEQKPPKWKQLKDNRARVRYLYRNMMTEKIRHGESVYAFETPSELSERKNNSSEEQKLFDVYVECRYDERKSPEPTVVAEIKRELDIK